MRRMRDGKTQRRLGPLADGVRRSVWCALVVAAMLALGMGLSAAAQASGEAAAQARGSATVHGGGGTATQAESAAVTPVVSPAMGEEYARPHELVDVGGGRKMNLFCMGTGTPTVVFDSGLSDWSSIWALVQPGVARVTRACSYDRAGMGYSDFSAAPRTPVSIDEDLHTLLHNAKIAMPVVLVGHSLGGFNMKLYAALYPKEVAGLVLVDPSEERSYERTVAAVDARYGAAVMARISLDDIAETTMAITHYSQCAEMAARKDLDPESDVYKMCTDPVRPPLGPAIAAAREKIQVTGAYQETQASELAYSIYGDPRGDAIYARLFAGQPFGARPLIVLTHSIYDAKDTDAAAEFFAWNTLHNQTARLSRRGVNRIVPGTHHNIEVDKPQAIVDAVTEVVKRVRAQ
ncbi:MAG: alpha/beta fold hydrolase [Acidobacteriaceae bacterium]